MTKDKIKKALELCTNDEDCERCPYCDTGCTRKLRKDSFALIIEQEQEIDFQVQDRARLQREIDELKQAHEQRVEELEYLRAESKSAVGCIDEQASEIETLKTALNWYMNMYGCRPERNVYDDNVEYSCNGYVTDEEDATALLKAKGMIDWFA